MTTLYLQAESVAPNVILSGDPWRVDMLARYLDAPTHVGFYREFNTYTGTYKGMPVTVSSTGIGAPSAAIALEELYEAGMRRVVRMGTSMALRDELLGTFLIPLGAMRREQTSASYVESSYPAIADLGLIKAMCEAVQSAGNTASTGLFCSMDGFYTHMHESRFSKELNRDFSPVFDELRALHIDGVDMESSCILTVARLMGIPACIVTLVTVLENLKTFLCGEERAAAEDLLCRVTLEGLYTYHLHQPERSYQ